MKSLLLLAFFALAVSTNATGQKAAAKQGSRRLAVHDARIHRPLPARSGPPRPVTTFHGGCEFLAFSNRAFKVVDLQVSSPIRNPADCIAWLRNNMKTYHAVEYNAKTSTCRAVKLAKWNNTVPSRASTLFAQKPSIFGNPSALMWYYPFDAKYERISEHLLIEIVKEIKKYVRNLPARARLHVERILTSAYRSKLALKHAAKRYYNKHHVADKKSKVNFEIWWLTLEKYLRAAAKFIDGKVNIKHHKINHDAHRKSHSKKHKSHSRKNFVHSLPIPADQLPFVTRIIKLAGTSTKLIENAARQVHREATDAGKTKLDFNVWWRSVKLYVLQTVRAISVDKIHAKDFKLNGLKVVMDTKNGVKVAIDTSKANGKN